MPVTQETKPVEDTVAKVNNEIAVGSDLEFQRRWWKFERITWIVLAVLILLAFLGCFGRGPLAKGHTLTSDGSLDITYERICRFGTPSIMTVTFGSSTIHQQKIQLWVEETMVKALGTQRVVPQPEVSAIAEGGILYTFPVTINPLSVEFQLTPAKIGKTTVKVMAPGFPPAHIEIFVMP